MRFKNKKVLVYGIAKSGIAAANFLGALGATVLVYDDNKFVLKSLFDSNLINVKYDIAFNFNEELLSFIDLMVISPSISIYNEHVKQAILNGVKVISELELGFLKANADILAITGTNGKTTTVRIIENIFKMAKLKHGTVGNIGIPITEFLTYENPKPTYLIEVSSFQLEAVNKFRPKIAAILNLTKDHMDRHYTMENYIKQKANIFKKMKKNDIVVLNKDDIKVFELKKEVKSKVYFFSTKEKVEKGTFVKEGNIIFTDSKKEHIIMKVSDVKLKGEHNLSNILCAVLICMLYGLNPKQIKEGVKNFKGVKHRLQFVKVKNKISYYNDSKATNIDSCLKAVNSFKNKTILILGGSDKGENYDILFKNMPSHIKHIVVTGDNATKIMLSAKSQNYKNIIEVESFENAVKKAKSLANKNYVVLLAPASASFDNFKDYIHRGEEFERIVGEL